MWKKKYTTEHFALYLKHSIILKKWLHLNDQDKDQFSINICFRELATFFFMNVLFLEVY